VRIELTESLWRLGLLPINAARPFAIEALAEGFSGPALFELADGGYGTWREVEETFAQALIEIGHAPLTVEEASMQAAWCICEGIASGATEPYGGIDRIGNLLRYDGLYEAFGSLIYFAEINADHDGRSRGDEEEIRQLARALVVGRGEGDGSGWAAFWKRRGRRLKSALSGLRATKPTEVG